MTTRITGKKRTNKEEDKYQWMKNNIVMNEAKADEWKPLPGEFEHYPTGATCYISCSWSVEHASASVSSFAPMTTSNYEMNSLRVILRNSEGFFRPWNPHERSTPVQKLRANNVLLEFLKTSNVFDRGVGFRLERSVRQELETESNACT